MSSWWRCRRTRRGWTLTTCGSWRPPSNGQSEPEVIRQALSLMIIVLAENNLKLILFSLYFLSGSMTFTQSGFPSLTGSPRVGGKLRSPSRCRRSSMGMGRWRWTSLKSAFPDFTTRSPRRRKPNNSQRFVSCFVSSGRIQPIDCWTFETKPSDVIRSSSLSHVMFVLT